MQATDLSLKTHDPLAYYKSARSPVYKRAAYLLLRPLLSWHTRRLLGREYQAVTALSCVLTERGFPAQTRIAWVTRHATVRNTRVLIQGAGTGWDALLWAELLPREILGIELYPFESAWKLVQHYARKRSFTVPEFLLGDLGQLPIASESLDLIASDAVWEHCRDMRRVLSETFRVLRPGGYAYASYGPMWFSFGGDHFCPRVGLQHGYAHLELAREQYIEFFQQHRSESEDAQSGGRYVELDLFSKLTTRQYLRLYQDACFELLDFRPIVQTDAVRFARKWPDRIAAILRNHPHITADDLLITGNIVILRKPFCTGVPVSKQTGMS